MANPAILISLQRCTGCWTCSFACKVAHELPTEEWWQYVRTIGGHRTDEPGGTWPNVSMKWMPVYTADCTFCGDRQADGLEPYCAYNCPTEAMTFGDLDDSSSAISLRMKELEGKGYRIFQLPKHEKTRSEIYYAERM